jgi:endonuclease/exonuclease/phosphatase family metal-dependent hydrolase
MTRTKLKLIFLILFVITESAFCSISVCSWNLQNFGNSKSNSEVDFMASTIQNFDVIAIQEVIAGSGGVQVVERLVALMNRKGESWDYTISNPTISSSSNTSERYAFIWNKRTVTKLGAAWLENHYVAEIDREPYFATFLKDGKEFTIVSFHAKPKAKQPETEIKYFKFFPNLYPKLNLIFCGDFNCPQSHTVFNPLKTMGYVPALVDQKTTLRMKCVLTDCLASEYDNFFYNPTKTILLKSGIIHFYQNFSSMEKARRISDHVPIYLTFK